MDPLLTAPQKRLCPTGPPICLSPGKPPLQKGAARLRLSDLSGGNGEERGGRIPREIETVMMTVTLCHCWGPGSAWGGDPDPSQPHRGRVPCTFLKPAVGVPWEGTVPPVPGRGRGKDLHTVPAVGKPLLSFSPAPAHPRRSLAPGGITAQGPRLGQAPGTPPHRPRTGLGDGGGGCEASRGCCGRWDKRGRFFWGNNGCEIGKGLNWRAKLPG